MMYNYFTLVLLFVVVKVIVGDIPCGKDWEAYETNKCFKVLTKHKTTYDDALALCKSIDDNATLPFIHSQYEQDFIVDLLFNKLNITDSVWIGAKFVNEIVTWDDGLQNNFANWVHAKNNISSTSCVKMVPDNGIVGKWVSEICTKLNVVVCQKMSQWSLHRVAELLVDYKKVIDENSNKNSIKIADLRESIIPVGFIYVQLPGEPDPQILWSHYKWHNVSPHYAGMFFRAEGGASNKFEGGTQEANSPRLTQIVRQPYNKFPENIPEDITIKRGEFTPLIYTGQTYSLTSGVNYETMKFMVSDAEVRPMNQAIRIWKRVK